MTLDRQRDDDRPEADGNVVVGWRAIADRNRGRAAATFAGGSSSAVAATSSSMRSLRLSAAGFAAVRPACPDSTSSRHSSRTVEAMWAASSHSRVSPVSSGRSRFADAHRTPAASSQEKPCGLRPTHSMNAGEKSSVSHAWSMPLSAMIAGPPSSCTGSTLPAIPACSPAVPIYGANPIDSGTRITTAVRRTVCVVSSVR